MIFGKEKITHCQWVFAYIQPHRRVKNSTPLHQQYTFRDVIVVETAKERFANALE